MKRLLILLLAASVSAPALAQHSGHTMSMPMPMPMPQGAHTGHPAPNASRPAARRPRAARPPARRRAAAPARRVHAGHARPAATAVRRRATPPANPHAGHNMPMAPGMQMPAPAANPHAGHTMPMAPGMQMPSTPAPANPHAGHDMGNMPQQPGAPAQPMPGHDMGNMQGQGARSMPGHDMSGMTETATDPPVAPPSAAAASGPAHAADTIYPADSMTGSRTIFRDEHGRIRNYRVLLDQLEARIQNGRDGYAWDGEAWYGGALNRLVLKTEGEGTFGSSPEHAEVQGLWSRALDPWFNLQAGVRYDIRPNPGRGYLVVGVEGIAPYWFEVDGALFLSNKGDLSARVEAEYEQRITQRLILQPRIDLDFSLQDVPELRTGSGLTTAEAGLRLRYQIVPEFAPYVGVHYQRAFGDTARFRRAAGGDIGGWSFLVGVRTWF